MSRDNNKGMSYQSQVMKKILISSKPWQGFQFHYLMTAMKRQIDKIRSIYDYQAGNDFVEMLEFREGITDDFKTSDITNQSFNISCQAKNYVHQPQTSNVTSLNIDEEKVYWIFVIEGQILYNNQSYKSGSSVFIDSNQQLLRDSKPNNKNSFLAIFKKENCEKITKLKFLRQRNQHIKFFSSTFLQALKSKHLMLLHHQLVIIKPFITQDIQTILCQFNQSSPQINYNAIKHKNKFEGLSNKQINNSSNLSKQSSKIFSQIHKNQQFQVDPLLISRNKQIDGQSRQQNGEIEKKNIQIDHLFMIYEGEVKVIGSNANLLQVGQISILTPGSIFGSFKTYQYLKSLLNLSTDQSDQGEEYLELRHFCASTTATIFAIPAFRFNEFPLNSQKSILIKIVQTLNLRIIRAKNLLKFRSKSYYKSNKSKLLLFKKKKNLSSKSLIVPQIFVNSKRQYEKPIKTSNSYFSSKNLNKKDLKISTIRSKTLQIGGQIKHKSQTSRDKNTQDQKMNTMAITSPYGDFFVPQQFVSKKLKMKYEDILQKIRRKPINTSYIQKDKNDRNYIEEYINERRIVKKGPRQKFLPLKSNAQNDNKIKTFRQFKYHGQQLFNKINEI